MDDSTRTLFTTIHTTDRAVQTEAYYVLIAATDPPVDWAYEVWDQLLADLHHKDNHVRSIAAQVLCNIAKSDPEGRMLKDFTALLNVTRDIRSVTARHCMRALWKIGVAGDSQQRVYIEGLAGRFAECVSEKNCTLIRFDTLQSLRNVYNVTRAEEIRQKALALIATETDEKYRKKYSAVWKGA